MAGLTANAKKKYEKFKKLINDQHKHPKQAADAIGDSDYKLLKGKQYQIRLDGAERLSFFLDDKEKTATFFSFGHT